MSVSITPMAENTPVVESFNTVQKPEIETAIAAMEASAVSADQKDALDAAEAPSAANPFVTQSELDAVTLDIAALDPASVLSDEDVTPQLSHANSEVEKASFGARWTHFLGTIRTWTKAPRIYNELEIMPGSDLTNYTVAGIDGLFYLKITPTADINFNSLAAGAQGRFLLVENSVSGYTVTLKNNHSGSTAANRFSIGGDIVLGDSQMALIYYDTLSSRWRCALSGLARSADVLALSALDADGTLAANSPGKVPAQSAVVTYVAARIAALVNSSPSTLDTLNELATALGNDPSFATTVATALGLRELSANKDASGGYAGLTLFKINFWNALGTVKSFFTNANTAARTYTFQDRNGTIADDTDLALKAPLASPAFTGNPTVPDQTAGDNSTKAANTKFVTAAIAAISGGTTNLDGLSDVAITSPANGDTLQRIGGTFVNTPLTTAVEAAMVEVIKSRFDYWFEARDITGLSNGASVASWPNTGSAGGSATQATGTKKPTYRAGGSGIGSLPALEFDGTTDYMTLPNLDNSGIMTFVCIFRPDGTSASDRLVVSDNDGGWGVLLNHSGGDVLYITHVAASPDANGNAAYAAATNHLAAIMLDGTYARFKKGLSDDGATSYNTTFDSSGGTYTLGGRGAGEYFDGKIALFGVMFGTLSGFEWNMLRDSLLADYGL